MNKEKIVSALGKFVKLLKFKLETDGSNKANIELEIGETDSTPAGKLSVKIKEGQNPDIKAEVGEFETTVEMQPRDGMPAKYDGLKPLSE